MDQNLLAQKFREMYPTIELEEDQYDPNKNYGAMVFLYRNGRHVRIIYGPEISYNAKKRSLNIWHIDNIPELVYKADVKKLMVVASGTLDLSRFPNLEILDIRDMDPNLIKLDKPMPKLKDLGLADIDDDVFPQWARLCPNLEKLWIYNCKITRLPEWLSELPIKSLWLKSLAMTDLPHWLPKLPLNELRIENLPLGKFPEVYRNWKRRGISLVNCGIKEIPEWIAEISERKGINFSRNLISEVPCFLFEKLKLSYIDLSHNHIKELPSGVWKGQSFYKLDLSHNQIRELPDDFGEMEIKELELNHNPIKELPYFKHYKRDIFDLSHTDLDYPMFWKQGYDWLKNIRIFVVPDKWDMEMLDAARRLMDFPKLGIYTYSEYQEYTSHF